MIIRHPKLYPDPCHPCPLLIRSCPLLRGKGGDRGLPIEDFRLRPWLSTMSKAFSVLGFIYSHHISNEDNSDQYLPQSEPVHWYTSIFVTHRGVVESTVERRWVCHWLYCNLPLWMRLSWDCYQSPLLPPSSGGYTYVWSETIESFYFDLPLVGMPLYDQHLPSKSSSALLSSGRLSSVGPAININFSLASGGHTSVQSWIVSYYSTSTFPLADW